MERSCSKYKNLRVPILLDYQTLIRKRKRESGPTFLERAEPTIEINRRIIIDIGLIESRITIYYCEGNIGEQQIHSTKVPGGGNAIDHGLLDIFEKKKEIDLNTNRSTRFMVLLACEKAKLQLSKGHDSTGINVKDVPGLEGRSVIIHRKEFENLCDRIATDVIASIKKASFYWLQQNLEILFVGRGGNKYIRDLITDAIKDEEVARSVHSINMKEEAQAIGAAGWAAYTLWSTDPNPEWSSYASVAAFLLGKTDVKPG